MASDKIVGYKMVEYKNVGGEMSGIHAGYMYMQAACSLHIIMSTKHEWAESAYMSHQFVKWVTALYLVLTQANLLSLIRR